MFSASCIISQLRFITNKCQVLLCAYFYNKRGNVVHRNTVTFSGIGNPSLAIPG